LNHQKQGHGQHEDLIFVALAFRCDFLVVKSISDWADEKKGDSKHAYCTKVSADLVISMIEDETI
jgi:nucleoside phosphorylase